MKKLWLLKGLRDAGCDTAKKLRAAHEVIQGTLRVNPSPPPFRFNNGYIDHG